jgi:hypothetical protein
MAFVMCIYFLLDTNNKWDHCIGLFWSISMLCKCHNNCCSRRQHLFLICFDRLTVTYDNNKQWAPLLFMVQFFSNGMYRVYRTVMFSSVSTSILDDQYTCSSIDHEPIWFAWRLCWHFVPCQYCITSSKDSNTIECIAQRCSINFWKAKKKQLFCVCKSIRNKSLQDNMIGLLILSIDSVTCIQWLIGSVSLSNEQHDSQTLISLL